MKAAEWIDRVKKTTGIESDYGVAKALGLSRTTISTYRVRPSTLDEEVAIKVANALGERPEAVVLDQMAERVKTPDLRTALLAQARALCILCSIGWVVQKASNGAASGPIRHTLDGIWPAMA